MDHKLLQQIYPYVARAKEIPNLKIADRDLLTADLYLAIARYYNSEIPKYLGRLGRLEGLKKGKCDKYLENIKKQEEGILEESKARQSEILVTVYNKWLENLRLLENEEDTDNNIIAE